jgi:hypothetical protein
VNDPRAGHLDDLAELYALGALPEIERAAADAHIASCSDCERRVGEAEETIEALHAPQSAPARLDRRVHAAFARAAVPGYFYAVAAALLILALLPAVAFWQRERAANDAQQQALAAMVNSHFLHSPFQPLSTDAPAAKVIYARNGAWLYVIANTDRTLGVSADGRTIGTLTGSGSERTLFVAHPPAVKAIELVDGTRAIARAAIAR